MKVSAISLLGLLSAAVQAHDVLSITINAKDAAPLYDVIKRNADVDYGCRPTVLKSRKVDEHKVHAFVSRSQLKKLRRSLDASVVRIDMLPAIQARQTNLAPIGKGNRFSKGGFPRGLGTRKPGEALGPILNVDEVTSAMKALEKEYGMDTFVTPFKTFEGRSLIGGIANKAEKAKRDKQHIYFTSGIHARERGGPDNLIYFVSDLLYANEHRIGVRYGNQTFSNKDVKAVLGAGIVFIPLTNPDGVVHDQTNSNLWRKNRNPTSSTPGSARSVGVDLNRNFDFVWNYTKYFDPELEPASNDPTSEVFYGTSPFSEPETRGIKWGMDQFPNLRWYIDVHSAAGTLLYSWGDDENQSANPKQNFLNPAYDGKRGVVGDEVYKEYIPQKDWNNIARVSNVTTAAMHAVGGREYISQQSVGLYPTSGASDDYAFSRHFADPKLNKLYGYTMEFGYPTNFYPTDAEYLQNILDTNAGFMTFILEAIKVGLKN